MKWIIYAVSIAISLFLLVQTVRRWDDLTLGDEQTSQKEYVKLCIRGYIILACAIVTGTAFSLNL